MIPHLLQPPWLPRVPETGQALALGLSLGLFLCPERHCSTCGPSPVSSEGLVEMPSQASPGQAESESGFLQGLQGPLETHCLLT